VATYYFRRGHGVEKKSIYLQIGLKTQKLYSTSFGYSGTVLLRANGGGSERAQKSLF